MPWLAFDDESSFDQYLFEMPWLAFDDEKKGVFVPKVPSKRAWSLRRLVDACTALNWNSPTKIQSDSIPHALQGKDIIGVAKTGTGKTGAFALPIIQALLEAEKTTPLFALVLAPTRELAIQIAEHFRALGAGIDLKTTVLVGGVDMNQQQLALAKRPHVLVATPGRLMDHLTNTKGFSLRTLKYLVLDEADNLLTQEFEKSLDDILKVIPMERRTYLFSATMTNKNCYLLYILLELSGSAVVFARKCDTTQVVALMLRNLGLRAVPINGKMTQEKRLGALKKFKSGDCNILISTDVASRGLDIPSVDMVVNYEIPSSSKIYIHRVGRTASAGRTGVAISLVNQYELEHFIQIEKSIVKKLPKHSVQEEEVLLLLERVNEAKRIAEMKIKESGGRKRKGMEDEEGAEINKILDRHTRKSNKQQRRR